MANVWGNKPFFDWKVFEYPVSSRELFLNSFWLSWTPLSYLMKDERSQIYLAYVLHLSADPWHFSVTLAEGTTFFENSMSIW